MRPSAEAVRHTHGRITAVSRKWALVVLVAGFTTAWANGKAGATHVYDEPPASVYEWVLLYVLVAGVIAVMVAKIVFDRKRRLPGAGGVG
jgi:hypothetical protein